MGYFLCFVGAAPGTMNSLPDEKTQGRIEWRRSILWLLLLVPFFFLSYGFANSHAEKLAVTDALFFAWERQIPFIPWTIVPYWSIDLLYGLSFLYCRTPRMVDRHAFRLLTVQLISVTCFFFFPLHFAFERPDTGGLFGLLFNALMGFDKPYNQAPSLHIGLLVVIWLRFAQGTDGLWRWLAHIWAFLIGVSVLTTYQHHFIDIPTGVAVGLIAVWLWPDQGDPLFAGVRLTRNGQRRRLALMYGLATAVLALTAVRCGGIWLWLFWPALALALVTLNYAVFGTDGFQKLAWRHSVAVRALCLPYLLIARLNSRWWTRHHPEPVNIRDDVWLGRMPSRRDMSVHRMEALCDVTAELPAPRGAWRYANLPWLDLVAPTTEQLLAAAQQIESFHRQGRVLVCCALGLSRSASAVAAWLLVTGRVASADEAIASVQLHRPEIVLSQLHHTALAACRDVGQQEMMHG